MTNANNYYDVIIIGAGAAGLMCAITAGRRGRRVLLLDHANKAGKKILMSGGGRCNFTNLDIHPNKFLSQNPHFCKSALARYTQWDFISLVSQHEIPWHEKKLGQLFCDNSSKDILNMLLRECHDAKVDIRLNTSIESIRHQTAQPIYELDCVNNDTPLQCESLVVASGGLSIPKMGASGFGYDVARQFDIEVLPTQAALVPFTLSGKPLAQLSALSGVSIPDVRLFNERQSFVENILLTHRGISGPAALQLSSYWQSGEAIYADLLPSHDVINELLSDKTKQPQLLLRKWLSEHLPKRFADTLAEHWLSAYADQPLQHLSQKTLQSVHDLLHKWPIKPSGTEGYRTAEVTIGGVNTNALSSTTMESKQQQGLYFIGEVVDVTGWLGGYNFQWAWASGHAAGEVA